ncbi:KdsC family phosphatase [Scleromatobacter humisilvae]|uniref:3-deoxy-D-manno-octulosonate 8-phosphate phosphatase KdsC n=1 Tax=Scleromatobacter humisilvae TaxID=2897159 RepID=A0A9X1YNP7_9BURK|nr:HAD family hydrolase [Scleromatobacter humisilvae]MCK9688830.1 HAD hydrolase family protein [Scleromatobacter humisilvae]
MTATPKSHLSFPPDVLVKAQGEGSGIKAAIFDVDGVLTDGTIWITEAGETLKNFNVLDGQGLLMLRKGGITPIVITGRDSPAVRRRVSDLGLPHAAFGASDKVAAANEILQALGVDWGDVAVIGDDWPDLPLFANAGFACAPADAHAEATGAAHYVTAREGGRGAAREFCDLLLMANGLYAPLMTKLLVTLDAR